MKTIQIIGLTGHQFAGKDTVADLLCAHAGFVKMAFADALRGELSGQFSVPLDLFTDRATKEKAHRALAFNYGTKEFIAYAYLGHSTAGKVDRVTFDAWLMQPRSPRELMQAWGTEYRRQQDPNYWVKQLASRVAYSAAELGMTRFVLSDIRFPNEAGMLRDRKGALWQVKRSGCVVDLKPQQHVSEVDGTAFGPDLVLRNDHDIRHLQGLVRDAFCTTQWITKP